VSVQGTYWPGLVKPESGKLGRHCAQQARRFATGIDARINPDVSNIGVDVFIIGGDFRRVDVRRADVLIGR
jgi:hypothetical protein